MHKTSQNIRIKSSCGGGKRPPLSVPKHHLRLSQNWLMTSGAVKLFFPLNSSLTFLWWGHYNCGASVLHCLKFQAWVEMKYFLNPNINFLELVKYFHVIDAQSVIGFIASLLHSLTEPAHSDAVGAALGTSYSWSLHLPICQA